MQSQKHWLIPLVIIILDASKVPITRDSLVVLCAVHHNNTQGSRYLCSTLFWSTPGASGGRVWVIKDHDCIPISGVIASVFITTFYQNSVTWLGWHRSHLNEGSYHFLLGGGQSVCDCRLPIFSGPPLCIRKKFWSPTLDSWKNFGFLTDPQWI